MTRMALAASLGLILAACATAPAYDDGYATLRCIAQVDGSLRDCQVLEEFPAGAGYGAAAVEQARNARLEVKPGMGEQAVTFTTRFEADPNGDVVIP